MSSAPERARAKVTVGVCGGVAAYRAVELVRALQDAGLDPHVVMTASAKEFVTPLTFAAISGHKVIDTLWSGGEIPGGESSVEHIEQAQTTQALVIVPATANILGKLANGIADDFLTTMYLATKAPVIIAPAMNVVMWEHPAVQANVNTLIRRGVGFVTPGSGYLACGMEGSGRLAELPKIVAAVLHAVADQNFETDLQHQTVLITAGGTREPLDGVRFLGNRSSGRMGYALAEAATRRGARVILISAATGQPIPPGVEFHSVSTAAEMREKVLEWAQESTIVLKAAAVADFRPVQKGEGKIAREGTLTLELEPTEDIVAEVVRRRPPGQTIVAFSAEMGEGTERARAKMLRKGVDAIVVNDVSAPGIGFDSERNAGTMLIGARAVSLPEMSKRQMAERILDMVVEMRRNAPVDLARLLKVTYSASGPTASLPEPIPTE